MVIRFTRDHAWIRDDGNVIKVGLTDFAQGELGEITFVELPEPGAHIEADGPVCSIDSLKSTSDVYAPVSGTVGEVNGALEESGGASLINKDPYGEGWLFTIRADNPDDLGSLMVESEYLDLVSAG